MNINKNIKVSETKTLPVQYNGKPVTKLKNKKKKPVPLLNHQNYQEPRLYFQIYRK